MRGRASLAWFQRAGTLTVLSHVSLPSLYRNSCRPQQEALQALHGRLVRQLRCFQVRRDSSSARPPLGCVSPWPWTILHGALGPPRLVSPLHPSRPPEHGLALWEPPCSREPALGGRRVACSLGSGWSAPVGWPKGYVAGKAWPCVGGSSADATGGSTGHGHGGDIGKGIPPPPHP